MEEEERIAPFRSSRIENDEALDVLREARGIGHGEKTAPGVAEEIDLVVAEMGAQGVEVVDLVGEGAGFAGRERAGLAGAALIPHDDFAIFREGVPGVRDVEILVIKAGTAVGDKERRGVAGAKDFVIDSGAGGGVEGGAVLVVSEGARCGKTNCECDEKRQANKTAIRQSAHKNLQCR